MQVEDFDGSQERQVLTACIVKSEFLGRVIGKLEDEPFRSRWSNIIWGWCKRHYTKYREAPVKKIEAYLEQYAQKTKDQELISNISRYLGSLSGEYERLTEDIDVRFALDNAQKHFNLVRLDQLREEIASLLEKGMVDQALSARDSFKKISLEEVSGINILEDYEVTRDALESKQKVLVRYPGAAGEFIGEELSEDALVAFMAQTKGGKSYTLLDVAWRAMRQSRQVAYFQVGDMSQAQLTRRILRRAAYRPIDPRVVLYPQSIVVPEGGRSLAMVDYEDKVFDKKLDIEAAKRAYKAITAKSGGRIWVSCHPIKTISAVDIQNILEEWDKTGRRCEVVIVDYAYNLTPVNPKDILREQVAYTWAILRQISQMRKCLVVTASQTIREGFSSWVLTRKHFADSRDILIHVTSFMGINMTDEEKSRGIMRLNFVVRREEAFSETYCLYNASCLPAAAPMVVSALPQSQGDRQ